MAQAPTYDKDWFNRQWSYQADPNQPDIPAYTSPDIENQYSTQAVKRGIMTANGQNIPYSTWVEMNKQKEAEKKAADMFAQGLNPDGSPIRPEYQTLLDPTTGMLQEKYQVKPSLLDPTTLEGFQALKSKVLGKGPSEWANLMIDKQKMEEARAREALDRQTLSAAAQARSELARKGGMSSGARERLAGQMGREQLLGRQQVGAQGMTSRLGILTEDEAQRNKLLPGFTEGEAKMAQNRLDTQNKAQEWNILKSLEEKRAKDAQDLAVYQEQIKKWGSEKEAEATRASGGGGK